MTEEVARRPATDAERALLKAPSIASQLPIIFDNKGQFDSVVANCLSCDQPIAPDQLRGTITRPIPSVAVVDAIGCCKTCNLITPVYYRLHDDMRLSGRARDGSWAQWKMRPVRRSWMVRFLSWLTSR